MHLPFAVVTRSRHGPKDWHTLIRQSSSIFSHAPGIANLSDFKFSGTHYLPQCHAPERCSPTHQSKSQHASNTFLEKKGEEITNVNADEMSLRTALVTTSRVSESHDLTSLYKKNACPVTDCHF